MTGAVAQRSEHAAYIRGVGGPTPPGPTALSDAQLAELLGRVEPFCWLHRQAEPGWIYFVLAGEALKIGYAVDVERRVAQLQTSSAEQVLELASIPGSLEGERLLHGAFGHLRIRGEWFRYEPDLEEFVNLVMDRQEQEDADAPGDFPRATGERWT